MTDSPTPPNTPQDTPPSNTPPAYQPPAYPTGYPSAPAYEGQSAPGAPVPGKTLGIVAFVLALVPVGLQLVGLVLGIVALVQSKKAGVKNGLALAAIIISSILIVISIIGAVVFFSFIGNFAAEAYQVCSVQGAEFVEVWGQQVPCSEVR